MKKFVFLVLLVFSMISVTSCKRTITEDISCYDVEKWFNVYAELELENDSYYLKTWCEPKDENYVFGGYLKMFGVAINGSFINADNKLIDTYDVLYLIFNSEGRATTREYYCSYENRGVYTEPRITSFEVYFSRDSYVGNVTYEESIFTWKW